MSATDALKEVASLVGAGGYSKIVVVTDESVEHPLLEELLKGLPGANVRDPAHGRRQQDHRQRPKGMAGPLRCRVPTANHW